MFWLILGIALWIGAHIFKRVMPEARAALTARMGEASKGVVAGILLGSVILMVIGYKAAEVSILYATPAWAVHANNLLMLFAVALLGLGSSKSRLRGKMRHPMLAGVIVWAVAHLLANGDLASVVLFGAMIAWAVLEMQLINTAEPDYTPFAGGSMAGDLRLGIISVVMLAVLMFLHSVVGPAPWPV